MKRTLMIPRITGGGFSYDYSRKKHSQIISNE